MSKHVYLRSVSNKASVALSTRRFRKQLLRLGSWKHDGAPGGVLKVTPEFIDKIISNFAAGVRDDVPVPLGHDQDAISSIGHIVHLDVDPDGSLWGVHDIPDEDNAKKLGTTWTGTSALIELNAVDGETGKELGPVLVHNAITNAPYIKDLAPFERVALGEDAQDAVLIALQDMDKQGGAMTLEEALEAIQETSDDDLRAALETARPDLMKVEDPGKSKEEVKAAEEAAKAKGKEELVAALAEKGITVALSEGDGKDSKDGTEVDLSSAPEVVQLNERVAVLEGNVATTAATTVIDQAIKDQFVLPAQRDALLVVALGEKGMETLAGLIPEVKVMDLSEQGAAPGEETNAPLTGKDASTEADRLVAAYGSSTSKKEATA